MLGGGGGNPAFHVPLDVDTVDSSSSETLSEQVPRATPRDNRAPSPGSLEYDPSTRGPVPTLANSNLVDNILAQFAQAEIEIAKASKLSTTQVLELLKHADNAIALCNPDLCTSPLSTIRAARFELNHGGSSSVSEILAKTLNELFVEIRQGLTESL
jgi:hypothetical protein